MGNTAWGAGAVFVAGSSQRVTNTTVVLPTAACTVVVACKTGQSLDTGTLFSNRDIGADTSRMLAHMPYSANVYWDYGGSGAPERLHWVWPDAVWFNQHHVMSFIATATGGREIWGDGVLVASSSGGANRVNVLAGLEIGGKPNATDHQNATVSALWLFNRAFSADENRQIAADVFRFLRRPLRPAAYHSLDTAAAAAVGDSSASRPRRRARNLALTRM